MRRLSSLIGLFFAVILLQAQSPHGTDLKLNCAQCHSPASWTMDPIFMKFDHDSTGFKLSGRHQDIDCKSCHTSLVFSELHTASCNSCHLDVHQNSLGKDCNRCHNTASWIVDEMTKIHSENGFPLLGKHATVDCKSCHSSESELRFERIGNDCINCHKSDYNNTLNPDHQKSNFSTECSSCHDPVSFEWNTPNFQHDFFPLVDAHAIKDCKKCHQTSDYTSTSAECYSCHQKNFENSLNPNHQAAQLSINCNLCHTPKSDWEPAQYIEHDALHFPIYSGEHKGKWKKCNDCHLNPSNYKENSCIVCHSNPEVDDQHKSVYGYFFNDNACLACHPNGDKDFKFNHNNTSFPLTGAHQTVECKACHISGFKGTSSVCADCHQLDFNNSKNPNHSNLGFSMDCASCHTTAPDWKPARFDNHDQSYVLKGSHKIIASDCAACHKGDYNNTPNTCAGCHLEDYNQTLDPPHPLQRISTDCATCHTENAWVPSTFDHDGQYFPVYSGKHRGVWTECKDCHTNPANPKEYSCVNCHANPETDNQHQGVPGYWYKDQACFACHPTGDKSNQFDHNNTAFPLTGAHLQTECRKCHENGFKGTSSVCLDCHTPDYNSSLNPNHTALGFSTDCASCHTTQADWKPARLDNHDSYYVLEAAHKLVANDCAACHKGDYNNTPTTCAGCHTEDYNLTTNPPHKLQQFPTECASCHNQNSWIPSSFEHDVQYFPIYKGKHSGEWMQCLDCHKNSSNFKEFQCTGCHINPETDNQHQSVHGYWYQDQACFACHPTGDKQDRFDHNATGFVLTGAHLQVDCKQCHLNGFKGTPTTCSSCHTNDFNQSVNPNHRNLGFSMECASCHTTAPDWKPAKIQNHDQYYVITGAHTSIAMDCAACHNGNYNNTPNTCAGCHIEDYNKVVDPPHQSLQFSTECAACHTQTAWVPSTFDHDGQYFPINSGKHKGQWMECRDCHINPGNIKEFSCTVCHTNPETDTKHTSVSGYWYQDQACLACHPSGSSDDKFDHNNTQFPLTGAHQQTDCKKCHQTQIKGTSTVCVDCHQLDFNQSKNPDHTKLGFSMDCASCHTTTPEWKPARLDNHDAFFVLNGAHKRIASDCAACHKGNYNSTPNTCAGCHIEDFNNTKDPPHASLQFSTDCASCHTENAWVPSTFNHDGMYFPVYSGKHKNQWMDCKDCHTNPANFKEFNCIICHLNPETNEKHLTVSGYFYNSQACFACHPTGDGDDKFDHNTTNFPLTGAHIPVDCKSCHMNGFKGTPTNCENCHNQDFNNSKNPNHLALGFTMDCAGCHTTNPDWKPALMPDHDSYYPLTGAHKQIANACAACHHGNYNNTPNTCESCHQGDYNQSKDPNHSALGLPMDCASCHTTDPDWMPALFPVHDNFYPLTGAHLAISSNCAACHHGTYINTPNTCDGCHIADYNKSKNPNHNQLGLSHDCATCHTTQAGWEPAAMPNHDTYYPLTGAHQSIASDCAACHHGDYNNTPNTCSGCHTKDYNNSTNPSHKNLNLSMDCAHCHTTAPDWQPALFPEHNSFYQLNGAHAQIANDCAICHNGNYNNTPNTCYGCHQSDFNQTTNPDHEANQYPMDCASCHTENAWIPSTFDHNSIYPLTGAHAAIANDCVACHHGNYNNTPTTCNGCHSGDYNSASNPNHISLGFSRTCDQCHTTQAGWAPATMPNHDNYYPLTGAHYTIRNNCAACHNGNYNNTPNTCYGCHVDDYNQTNNPDHQSAQFPTNCTICHTTNAWTPSTFNHDGQYFPIYSGKHKNKWNLCADCHTNQSNYSVFSCILCHEHSNKTEVDNDHNGVSGYSYNSNACYSCHPQGKK